MRQSARLDLLPDDALLVALSLGEPDAAAVFVRRFQRRVFGLAFTIVGDRWLADEVAQGAFERAWRHAASYDARRASVGTWLLTITRNLAIDAVRVRRAVPVEPATIADWLPPAATADPTEAAIQGERLGVLGRELDALPDEQRRAVLLATVAGRTAVEIASLEGIPVGTAKTRIRAGLRRLRAATEVHR